MEGDHGAHLPLVNHQRCAQAAQNKAWRRRAGGHAALLTYDAAVPALQRGCGAGDGPVAAVLGRDVGADGWQGGAGAAGGR